MGELLGLLVQLGVQANAANEANKQTAEGKNYLLEALDRLNKLSLPDLQQIAPELLGPSEAGAVRADPQAKAQQLNTIAALNRIANSGGHTLEDDAAWNDFANKMGQASSANRHAIENSMGARGTLDSGKQLASLLAGAQARDQQAASFSAQRAADAQKRALQAIMNSGSLAGQMRNQAFSEDMQAAQARDLINRYNADALSKAQYYNAGLPQQQFENSIKKITGQNSAGNNLANFALGQAQGTRMEGGGLGVAANQGVQALYGSGSPTGGTGNYSAPPLVQADTGMDPSELSTPDFGSSSQGLTSSPSDLGEWEVDENGNMRRRNK